MSIFNIGKFNVKRKRGFTLIEIILAIAIIGILAVTFIPLFTSGYIMITKNGETSDNLFKKQDELEQKIAVGATTGSSILTVDFSGLPINVTGQAITNGEFYLFVPLK